MKRSLEALHSMRETRRSLKTEARFMVLSEAETISIDSWTADYGARLHDGVILAMDDQGLFLTAENPVINLKLGEKVSALFNLVGVEEKIRIEGEVVWINKYSNLYPKGFAIKFTDVNVKMKDFREGIDRSWVPEKKTNGQLSVLNIPD